MEREGYAHGGEYFCKECKHAHHILSNKGKEHIGFANKKTQRSIFKDFGVYSK
jgi:hypothetical protein